MRRERAGAMERGRKGQRELLAREMMVAQKEKVGIEESWGAREERVSEDSVAVCVHSTGTRTCSPLPIPWQLDGASQRSL